MDNASIARVFAEIGDLLEIKNENPFRVRAYRTAAETIATMGERVADLPPDARLKLPGIGKDLAAKIGELLDTGGLEYHKALLKEFPPTVLDLLRLQGVGPKTVALLYGSLDIKTLEDLEAAARSGRLRGIKGMGEKKAALILKAIEDRKQLGNRRLISDAQRRGRGDRRPSQSRRAEGLHHPRRQPSPGLRHLRRPRHRRRRAGRRRRPGGADGVVHEPSAR